MQLLSSLAILAAITIGITQAKPSPTIPDLTARTAADSKNCGKDEFFYLTRSCCLSHGGPPAKPSPPGGVSCPSTWYWHHGQGCCVPEHPNPPTPSCPKNYGWEKSRQCCTPNKPSHTPPPPPSKPSPKPHSGGHYKAKRNVVRDWDNSFCPNSLTACPIKVNGIATGDKECIDTYADVSSCGGCLSMGAGKDCSKIPHAISPSCLGSECYVQECVSGFKPSADATSCIKA